MRSPKSLWLTLLPVTALVALWGGPALGQQGDNLCRAPHDHASFTLLFSQLGCSQVQAFWCVVATFLALLAVVALQSKRARSRVVVYRHYERALLDGGHLKLEDLLNYHSQYSWGNYAAVTIGMVLLTVTLLALEADSLDAIETTIQNFAVFCMTAAAIMLSYADLMHTNTQTPIIPIKTRFELIDTSVRFGTLGTMITILAVLFFVAMISLPATAFACAVFVAVLLWVQSQRSIPKDELLDYFKITPPAGQDADSFDLPATMARDSPRFSVPYELASDESVAIYRRLVSAGAPPARLEDARLLLRLSEREAENARRGIDADRQRLADLRSWAAQHDQESIVELLDEAEELAGVHPGGEE